MYTEVELPPLIPPFIGGKQESSSLPLTRGGLGWGKTVISQLFQTCVYTVALAEGEIPSPLVSPQVEHLACGVLRV